MRLTGFWPGVFSLESLGSGALDAGEAVEETACACMRAIGSLHAERHARMIKEVPGQ